MGKKKHLKGIHLVKPPSDKEKITPPEDFIGRYDRVRAMDSYSSSIGFADTDALRHLQSISYQIQRSFNASIVLSFVILAIAIIILGASLYIFIMNPEMNNSYQHIFSVICFIGSFAILAGLIVRNPLSNIKQLVGNIAKLNILFLGYVRQLNVIDATFRNFYISSSRIGESEMQTYLEKVQDALNETVSNVNQLLDEFDD